LRGQRFAVQHGFAGVRMRDGLSRAREPVSRTGARFGARTSCCSPDAPRRRRAPAPSASAAPPQATRRPTTAASASRARTKRWTIRAMCGTTKPALGTSGVGHAFACGSPSMSQAHGIMWRWRMFVAQHVNVRNDGYEAVTTLLNAGRFELTYIALATTTGESCSRAAANLLLSSSGRRSPRKYWRSRMRGVIVAMRLPCQTHARTAGCITVREFPRFATPAAGMLRRRRFAAALSTAAVTERHEVRANGADQAACKCGISSSRQRAIQCWAGGLVQCQSMIGPQNRQRWQVLRRA
jgi:hypothetical protein